MGRPWRSQGGEACPIASRTDRPSELGPLGLAGLLNPTGPRVGTAGFTHIEEIFQDPGEPRLALLAGNSSILVLHDPPRSRPAAGRLRRLSCPPRAPSMCSRCVSPAFQFGTAALSVGGSAGARLATDAHSESELPAGAVPEGSEDPLFFSLLEDDQLITRIDLSAYRWLPRTIPCSRRSPRAREAEHP
jgi:hypothetical protein